MGCDYGKICKENGIYTRIVSCCLNVWYDEVSKSCEQEYLKLADMGNDGFNHYLEHLKLKNKIQDGDGIVIEILTRIYQKLVHLENLIQHHEETFLPLKQEGIICALGHGVVCLENADFKRGQKYYMRFELPVFPQRYIGIFVEAFDKEILKITQMHQRDIQDFDTYIANKEIENLRIQHKRKDI
ncbi:hypothetical protein [Helicobacter sp. 11S03491-1]|uniref:hypothetical protein n=1 Tax=Helicobacter sp. 11S03491-1 TaxID=1476196 RepID=UPI000BA4F5A9|nr:hypothetical protein [Helicobacter sp. 11S03491-1]PAF42687.1 hypothetical protein BKH45_04040 [Helicobacter sp. 11S03491-1]